ncbi:MAG: hypothetical protein Q7V88_10210 [Actinomycetota bacterium]|nr:hypothetical protein [Actinomycetota bacterium]
MLSPTAESIRLFLHVLAASVWVGGQFVVAGIVPGMRRTVPEGTKAVAQGFARVAWPAYGITVITGMWSLMSGEITDMEDAYQGTLLLKIGVAIAAGIFAAIHSAGKSKLSIAVGGALGLLCSVAALFLGIVLTTAS